MRKQGSHEEREREFDPALRDKAEAKLNRPPGASLPPGEKTPEETIHELQVHQIELEMQNEELRRTQLALEESRRKYLDLYDFAPVGYFTLNDKSLIAEVNLTGAELLGVMRRKLTKGRFRRFVTPGDQGLWDRHLLSVLKGEEKQTCDLVLRRVDGSTFPAHLESIRLAAGDGASVVRTMVSDITGRRQAEKIIEEKNKELEGFNYSIAHDLRAPLRVIYTYARMLQKELSGRTDGDVQRKVDVIRKNAGRMDRLISDLLAFSRLGRQALSKKMVDMGRLVQEVWREVIEANPDKKVNFRVATLPPCWGDRMLLKQVWANLFANALKYTRSKETADIQVGSYNEVGFQVFFVRDKGAGFEMQYREKLFGIFERLHSAEEFEGTGVGLAIVQQIINRHRGKVWAEGKVDEGATFYLSLPLPTPEEVAAAERLTRITDTEA